MNLLKDIHLQIKRMSIRLALYLIRLINQGIYTEGDLKIQSEES